MRKFFFLFLFIFSSLVAPAQADEAMPDGSIPKKLYYLIDEDNKLQFDDVRSAAIDHQFIESEVNTPNLGKGRFTVWLKITFTTENEGAFLEIAYPTFDTLDFYSQVNNEWAHQRVGDVFPFAERSYFHRNFVFELPEAKGLQENTVYIRVNSRGSMMFPIIISSQEAMYKRHIQEELLYGLFYGIMLVMLLYNLFLAYSSRSKSYLYYVLIIAGNLLTLSALNGHAFQYLWHNWPWWGNQVVVLGIGLWISASNLFAISFLDIQSRSKLLYFIHQGLLFAGLVNLLSAFVLPYEWGMFIGNMLLPVNCVVLLISGVYFWIKGVKVASLFTAAWSIYLLGVLVYNFRSLGMLPATFFTNNILEIGAAMEVILLSLALGTKYRQLEKERDSAQKEMLSALSGNQDLIKKQNQVLEQGIFERTKEIENKQAEIVKQNNELQLRTDELQLKNNALTKAQVTIEAQNQMLKDYSENLEKEVAERTMEIRLSNSELADNVQKLEQYAYITAHNLRAPVARLMGLMYLLELQPKDVDDPELLDILNKIKTSSNELDEVIKDINMILELSKNQSTAIECLDIEKAVEKAKHLLRDSFTKYGAELELDFKVKQVRFNAVFMDSILYNLLSNALKYRDTSRLLQIKISCEDNKTDEYVKFCISDNGIGIDTKKYKDKLFGMYRRFHEHVEGKGLGLYLVKSQMEMMGGSITVESSPGNGTTFCLYFSK